ncbi:hypothetical protein HCC61_03715 [Streptomyces sp. HNM0575]|uniref:hypothetical protein n=1 Tax=Streptomyces sp. HNM0575 TaxID=2716338 RepID=UPI00145E494F|nr:hypothetical protein [Streptomyces sp. HNM0575]NLU71799.1 hypothetical protein [Streptomyces sp. HNM0575]
MTRDQLDRLPPRQSFRKAVCQEVRAEGFYGVTAREHVLGDLYWAASQLALLTGRWRALRHVTTSPRKTSHIIKAALVLTHLEHGKPN